MAETDVSGAQAPAQPRERGQRGHPSPREYVRVAIILAVATSAEVSVYYMDAVRDFLIPLLFFFAIVKFSLVALWYMHLRFDSRVYARFFVMGIAFAMTLYVIVLVSFRVFAK